MATALRLARSAAGPAAAAENLRRRIPPIAVGAAVLIAVLWYGALLLARDSGLRTPAYDQAFFQQLLWNLDHGHWFASSFTSGSFLGLHFEPLLLIPAGLELFWSDPRLLSLLTAVSVGALAPAAYLFLRALIGRPGVAAALAAPLPFWPALQEAARAGFHPEMMGVDLALLAGWAGLKGKTLACWGLALLSLCAKEDQAWNILVIGLVLATVPPRRRVGLQLAAVAIVWGVAVSAVVMPLIRAGQHVDTDNYYSWLQQASPIAVLHALTSVAGWRAVLVMLLCTGGLALRQPKWLALSIPPFFADLLSAHDPQPALHLQYALPLVIPVLVAAAMTARTLTLPGWRPALLAAPPLILAVTLGGLPPAPGAATFPFARPSALDQLAACTSRLPPQAPVAADDGLLAVLASRPSARELPAAQSTDYLVIDRQATMPGYVAWSERNRVRLDNRAILCDNGPFIVLGPRSAMAEG